MLKRMQTSFNAGELSPLVSTRVDLAKYQNGCKTLKNMFVHPQGSASNRSGFKFVAEAKYSDSPEGTTKGTILQEFIFNEDQAYVLEIGDEYVRFFTNGAQLEISSDSVASWNSGTTYEIGDYVTYNGNTIYYAIASSTNETPDTIATAYWTPQSIYEVPLPYDEADVYDLKFESSADTIFITHPDYKPQVLQRYGATDWRLSDYYANNGPFMPENTDDTITISASDVTGTVTLSSSSGIFASTHVGALWKLSHYIEGQTESSSFSGTGTGTGIKCFTTWRVISHGTWTGKFRVEKSIDGGSTWTVLRSFTGADDFNANTYGTEDIELNTEPFLVRINMYAYTSGTANIDITTDAFYQDGIVEIATFNSSTSVIANVVQEIGDTAATYSWSEGSWSDYRGYPTVCRFFQDRLAFGGTRSEPMTVWFTETANYFSFARHDSLLGTDGITANLPSRQLNEIRELISLRRLIVLTSAMEWSIGSADDGSFTPDNFSIMPEGYRGSSYVSPVVVGNELICVLPTGRSLRTIAFDFATDSFTGIDINILAKHLFDKEVVIDMAYQQDPDSIVWILMSDGRLVGLTYIKEHDIIAFHQHETGVYDIADDGSINSMILNTIDSICCIPNKVENFDELWIVVNRENGKFIERMAKRNYINPCGEVKELRGEEQVFLDSSVTYSNQQDFETIAVTNGVLYTITIPNHGYSNSDVVMLRNVAEFPELNGTKWIIGNVTTDTFDLISEVT